MREDLVPVSPYQPANNMVTLGAGQRTDILVKANGSSTTSVYMRADISPICTNNDTTHSQINALAAIYYEKASRLNPPTSKKGYYDDTGCHNVSLTIARDSR